MINLICIILFFSFVAYSQDENITDDSFIPIEKQPVIDIIKLQKFVIYPKIALKEGISGRVIVKVLVDKNGKILKSKIEYADSHVLILSALDAIKSYGDLKPAVQKGKTVACWLSVPITYRLRGEKTDLSIFKGIDLNINAKINKFELYSNIEYPRDENSEFILGNVKVKTLIDEEGYLVDFKIVETSNEKLNEYAIKTLKNYGRATNPTLVEGKPVKSWITIPINFE